MTTELLSLAETGSNRSRPVTVAVLTTLCPKVFSRTVALTWSDVEAFTANVPMVQAPDPGS